MLKPIARAVHVDRRRRLVRRVGGLERGVQVEAQREGLHRVVGLVHQSIATLSLAGHPPAQDARLDLLVAPFDAVVERELVHAVQVGELHLEPAEAVGAERFRLGKLEQPTREVVAEILQVGPTAYVRPRKSRLCGK